MPTNRRYMSAWSGHGRVNIAIRVTVTACIANNMRDASTLYMYVCIYTVYVCIQYIECGHDRLFIHARLAWDTQVHGRPRLAHENETRPGRHAGEYRRSFLAVTCTLYTGEMQSFLIACITRRLPLPLGTAFSLGANELSLAYWPTYGFMVHWPLNDWNRSKQPDVWIYKKYN